MRCFEYNTLILTPPRIKRLILSVNPFCFVVPSTFNAIVCRVAESLFKSPYDNFQTDCFDVKEIIIGH